MDTRSSRALAFAAGAGVASLAWYFVGRWKASRGRPGSSSAGPPRAIHPNDHFVGIDLGATTVNVAILDDAGTILRRRTCNLKERSFEAVTELIVAMIGQVVAEAGLGMELVTAIGIGAPGNLDCSTGVVRNAANFDWKDAPLTAALTAGTGRPVFLENDANAAVLAEWWAGAGAGDDVNHLVMFTLGSGVGGGVVSHDRLISGTQGLAGELGHAIVEPCIGDAARGRLNASTGVNGILEEYASARSVGRRAQEALAQGRQSSLSRVAEVSCKDVFEHAAAGDELSRQLVDETAEYLAVGFVNACRAYDPQLIVVSGGMSLAGDLLLAPLRRHFERRWWSITPASSVKIVQATMGNDAGVIGAAAAARARAR